MTPQPEEKKMLIVGELINASRKEVARAIESSDAGLIKRLALEQVEAGARYIDVNAGIFVEREAQYLRWLVEQVQDAVDVPCCLDSPDPRAVEAALAVHRGVAMINSISLEKARREFLLPLLAGGDLKVVALCMSDEGMPETAADRVAIAGRLIDLLVQNRVSLDNIYVDPLVQPVSVDTTYGREILQAIREIMARYPGVHSICGLSNISYGLPARKLLNRTFAVLAVAAGLDSVIVNPLDEQMMAGIISAETLTGRDSYCSGYLKAYRGRRFDFAKTPPG
ncbi:MAG: methyltetrahydrofolate cobalamin methyltransferase [Smithellaceae bacterium]|nr:methyltetrahydrofolate cobalamin methyltransferase [Smithellaceae bacterium]